MQSAPPTTKLTVVGQPQHMPYARPLTEILSDLAKPVPERFLAQRKQGGQQLTYIPWHHVNKLLDYYAPGWEGEITKVIATSERVFVVYRLTIHAAEGAFSREASGTELLNCSSYGDPTSNAESMSFRRAAARFGLGLGLYQKDAYH